MRGHKCGMRVKTSIVARKVQVLLQRTLASPSSFARADRHPLKVLKTQLHTSATSMASSSARSSKESSLLLRGLPSCRSSRFMSGLSMDKALQNKIAAVGCRKESLTAGVYAVRRILNYFCTLVALSAQGQDVAATRINSQLPLLAAVTRSLCIPVTPLPVVAWSTCIPATVTLLPAVAGSTRS